MAMKKSEYASVYCFRGEYERKKKEKKNDSGKNNHLLFT